MGDGLVHVAGTPRPAPPAARATACGPPVPHGCGLVASVGTVSRWGPPRRVVHVGSPPGRAGDGAVLVANDVKVRNGSTSSTSLSPPTEGRRTVRPRPAPPAPEHPHLRSPRQEAEALRGPGTPWRIGDVLIGNPLSPRPLHRHDHRPRHQEDQDLEVRGEIRRDFGAGGLSLNPPGYTRTRALSPSVTVHASGRPTTNHGTTGAGCRCSLPPPRRPESGTGRRLTCMADPRTEKRNMPSAAVTSDPQLSRRFAAVVAGTTRPQRRSGRRWPPPSSGASPVQRGRPSFTRYRHVHPTTCRIVRIGAASIV